MIRIATFSLEKDIHAHAITHALRTRDGVTATLIATDALYPTGGLDWRSEPPFRSVVQDIEGKWHEIAEFDLIWWRRVNQPQSEAATIEEPAVQDFINNEWRAALSGIVFDAFKGVWVNKPAFDAYAGNKVYQLRHATNAGLRIPATIVSNQPERIREFSEQHPNGIIAKKIVGTHLRPLATIQVSEAALADNEGISSCPSMYQERILGNRHLRINAFGSSISAVIIDSPILDWRRDLSVPFRPFEIPSTLQLQLTALLKSLNLEMAVMDMMITDKDEFVWIELNTQGQFLFGEALSGLDITTQFCDFLIARSKQPKTPNKALHPTAGNAPD